MFSKAKRFEFVANKTNSTEASKKQENEKQKITTKISSATPKPLPPKTYTTSGHTNDAQSMCSSVRSTKSVVTPRHIKTALKPPSSLRKRTQVSTLTTNKTKAQNEQIIAQEIEIRNKDQTISECNKQIEEFKTSISNLQKQILNISKTNEVTKLNKQLSQLTLVNKNGPLKESKKLKNMNENHDMLKRKILEIEMQCIKLEEEVRNKQLQISSLEDLITIRDTLCKDLQEKLNNKEISYEETLQQLEMVKGHHTLALEANESIRKEYKAEIESLKSKLEEDKQLILKKYKSEKDIIIAKYESTIESIKNDMIKEKHEALKEMELKLINKECEMKAKLAQLSETSQERLKICEIQFEERSRNMQDHYNLQEQKMQELEKEALDLKNYLTAAEEQSLGFQREINNLKNENIFLSKEKESLMNEIEELKDNFKLKCIEYENEKNKLKVDIDNARKEKNKFEMSLSVTRDIVEVLTMRLRESDSELEHLENKVKIVSNSKEALENELATYKHTLNNTAMECNEYKEALVNVLKSKAALVKEHTRIMEHNVSLIDSLQNVEKEAYRELGNIKNELIDDVEFLRKESESQIQKLKDEVEKKSMLCELAADHAGQATVAAEQSRVLLVQADEEISRLEAENQRFQQELQDQQSLVVELSLLRQENEELTMTVAKQSSIIEKLQKEAQQVQYKPKSPSVMRKSHKIGKENILTVVSPLRERNS